MEDSLSSSTGASAPDQFTRFAAALIDGLIAALLSALFAAAPFVGGFLSAGYLVLRDGFDAGPVHFRSIGKYVMGLGVVRVDGGTMNLEASLRRNWMFGLGAVALVLASLPLLGGFLALLVNLAALAIILFEAYNVFTDPAGQRWGDQLAATKVVTSGSGVL